jgi:hypothetical protein
MNKGQGTKERTARKFFFLISIGHQQSSLETLCEWLDALGAEYRLAPDKQRRAAALLAQEPLQNSEERELEALLNEADEIMLRRAHALNYL